MAPLAPMLTVLSCRASLLATARVPSLMVVAPPKVSTPQSASVPVSPEARPLVNEPPLPVMLSPMLTLPAPTTVSVSLPRLTVLLSPPRISVLPPAAPMVALPESEIAPLKVSVPPRASRRRRRRRRCRRC